MAPKYRARQIRTTAATSTGVAKSWRAFVGEEVNPLPMTTAAGEQLSRHEIAASSCLCGERSVLVFLVLRNGTVRPRTNRNFVPAEGRWRFEILPLCLVGQTGLCSAGVQGRQNNDEEALISLKPLLVAIRAVRQQSSRCTAQHSTLLAASCCASLVAGVGRCL